MAKITDSHGVVWWEKKPSSTEGLSMLVRYKDGTEKKFYNLTSIDNITVSNKANAVSVEIYDGVTSIDEDVCLVFQRYEGAWDHGFYTLDEIENF